MPTANAPPEVMDARKIRFTFFIRLGSTGKPKAILHTHGGYNGWTSANAHYRFSTSTMKTVIWCAADPAGDGTFLHRVRPFAQRCDFVHVGSRAIISVSESHLAASGTIWHHHSLHGADRHPRLDAFGEAWPNKHDLTSLRLLGSVGEPINPEAWKWY